jgi:hypothetical protein
VAAYATTDQVTAMLGGQVGLNSAMGPGTTNTRDGILSDLVTRCSRMFDRETGRPTNYWAPATGVTRPYSGSGSQYLDVDEFDAITGVTMTSNQQRTDVQTLTVTDNTSPNYVEILPVQGPPFNQLFLLRGWLLDIYNVGNVRVTGNLSTPPEITHAVAIWAAYEWKQREAGWADMASRPDGPGLLYVKGIPPETKRIIDYFKDAHRGPKVAVLSGDENVRLPLWTDWMTFP